MQLNPIPTELTTAATDAILALLGLVCIRWLSGRREADPAKATLWALVLGLLVVASALGAAAHGLALSERAVFWLWQPLYLSLGLVVALFFVASVYDGIGPAVARRILIPALVVGGAFYLVTLLFPGTFTAFVLYEAVAMVAALVLYARLALRCRRRWAWLMTLGIALNVVAAVIQATRRVRIDIGIPLDHNGVFHLVQMVAIVVLVAGVVGGLEGTAAGKEED